MAGRFSVTYEIATPESAEHGDSESHGYVAEDVTLREALRECSPDEDCGRWWCETSEDRCDYATGAVETRAIHPPRGITPASYARVTRIMGIRVR